ncbi:sigma-70 family RNA polymerase sigma factor [Shewanella sp. CG12_big_fil_rev_8_21_14_0_65_47_15]|uniref:sigma-70 family RNA polymerase sigma factor n=1 Tax=Shewanella sp. CG12_big_fil_rev_8_21_14_0_65_47_15 TaxID=1975537 RepID=UPI000CC47613|nr:sigma-70 family RNA polymerase sigma factor [Shewanella sp. CG12_big_fil_rev_8_21_14_0_65_47_15]PIW61027.1 MAG: RNA polymerase subunit sigma-24 [Shewanella sp. CG12_big_fil_rev_8_21_14_0_65_47_15]
MALAIPQIHAHEHTDEHLMQRYAKGDSKAFEPLYLKHKGALYRYFVRQLGDKQLAEDLYQETWSRVIRAAANYEASAKFNTWLYRIAHNLLIDHVRAVKPVDLVGHDEEDAGLEVFAGKEQDKPDVQWQEAQKGLLLKACIGLLPQVQKEAFILNIEMGFTAAVISDIAGVTLEATKSRIRYAYQSLKDCVNAKWQEAGHE